MKARLKSGVAALACLFGACSAWAGESVAHLIAAGMPEKCAPFAAKVSHNEGTWKERNPFGCLGAFQFCPGTFERYNSGTPADFLNNPSAQVTAWIKYEKTQWALAQHYQLSSLIGTQVCYEGHCKTIDPSAILMACQFGCGLAGKLYNYAHGPHACDARNVKDGNGVSVCTYLSSGVGYEVSCFTGGGGPIPGPTPSPTACPPPPPTPSTSVATPNGALDIEGNGTKLHYQGPLPAERLEKLLNFMKAQGKP